MADRGDGPSAGRTTAWELRQLGEQYAAVKWTDGRRQRRRLGTDRGAARRAVQRLNAAAGPVATVADLWAAYVEDNRGKAVIETMRSTAKALAPVFFELDPELVTVADCRQHVARRRAAGIADGTLHTELGHLRMVLLWGVKRELIAKAPHVERPPKPAPRDHYLTRDQVNRLIAAATLPHVRLYLILLITTSARIGALLDLTWDRVDLERGLLYLTNPDDPVRRKGRATVPINRTAMAALQEARRGALSAHVIEYAGRPIRSVKKSIQACARRAGVRATPHVLRHSAAVWMAEAKIDDRRIAEYLGHSDVKMVQRVYARFRPDHLADAAEVLELDFLANRKGQA